MKLVLNENSQKKHSLLEFLNYSQKFYGVELDFSKIKEFLSESYTLKALEEVLETFNLNPTSIFAMEDFNLCSSSHFKNEIIPRLKEMLNYCYKIGCYLIIIQPSLINKTIPRWKIVRRTVKKLKEISKLSYKEDINIGFEFTAQPNSSVRNLEQTKEIMNQLKSQENLGYIIDTFYFSKTLEPFENLKEIRDFIYLIQLSDHSFKNYESREEILESDEDNRLLPGEGDFDFQKFLKYTKKLHYLKPFSIELFREINVENLYHKTLQNLDLPIMRRKKR